MYFGKDFDRMMDALMVLAFIGFMAVGICVPAGVIWLVWWAINHVRIV